MFKKIFFGILFSSSSIIITSLLLDQNNINNKVNLLNEQNNRMVFDIVRSLSFAKPTNGSQLKQGTPMSNALPLLWNTIDRLKTEAKKLAELIPTVGPTLIVLINNLNSQHLKLVDENEILHAGENIPRVILTIDESAFEMPMIITNIA